MLTLKPSFLPVLCVPVESSHCPPAGHNSSGNRQRANRIVKTSITLNLKVNNRKLPQFWHFSILTRQLREQSTITGLNLGVRGMCGVWDEWGWDGWSLMM